MQGYEIICISGSHIHIIRRSNIHEGRVEVTSARCTGTVCDKSWDTADTQIACMDNWDTSLTML